MLLTTHCEKSCKVNILQFQNIIIAIVVILREDLGTLVTSEGGGLGKETKEKDARFHSASLSPFLFVSFVLVVYLKMKTKKNGI